MVDRLVRKGGRQRSSRWALTLRARAPPSLETAETTEGGARISKSPLGPVIGIPAAVTVVAVVVTLIVVGSPVRADDDLAGRGHAAGVIASADAAESSGTVDLEITKDGGLWAAKTLRWNGTDLSVVTNDPRRVGRADLLVVDGVMCRPDPEVVDGWLELGPQKASIPIPAPRLASS